MLPPAASTSATKGPSLSALRRPAKTAKPSDANFFAIAAPMKSPAPITAIVASLYSNEASCNVAEIQSWSFAKAGTQGHRDIGGPGPPLSRGRRVGHQFEADTMPAPSPGRGRPQPNGA